MGSHYYAFVPCPNSVKGYRLAPAVALSEAGIPVFVWGDDALCFIQFVPILPTTLEIIVPDELFDKATSTLTASRQPYRIRSPPPAWREHRFFDRSEPSCYPRSFCLEHTGTPDERHEDTPDEIWLHPQSFFSIDVRDTSRSVSLGEFPANIRFPTRPVFLDTIINLILEPPLGYRHRKFVSDMLVLSALIRVHTLPNHPLLPSGELEPEHRTLMHSLKEENRRYFQEMVSKAREPDWKENIVARREVLRKRAHEVDRPLPHRGAMGRFPPTLPQSPASGSGTQAATVGTPTSGSLPHALPRNRPYSTQPLGRTTAKIPRILRRLRR